VLMGICNTTRIHFGVGLLARFAKYYATMSLESPNHGGRRTQSITMLICAYIIAPPHKDDLI